MHRASTGVTVERQPVPYPELVQKVLLAASVQFIAGPHLHRQFRRGAARRRGYLAPLAEVGIEMEPFVPALAALGGYEGADYAVPSANNTIALYYNTEMLEAAGRGAAEDLG